MTMGLSIVAQGSFISDGAARTIQFPKPIDYFQVTNRSTWGTAPAAVVEAKWHRGYAAGQAKTLTEGGGSALTGTLVAAGGAGFTEVNQSTFTDGAPFAVTGVTAATPAVAASATTPVAGQIVRLYGTTGMLQIAGMDFTVGTVNAGVSFQLANMPAAAFAAPATGGFWRLINDARYLPRTRYITAATVANPCVLTTSINHGYQIGDRITIRNPDANFGMPQINGRTARITAVTASTITTDIDSLAFTAFAFPTSAVAATGVTHPHIVPFGEVATSLLDPRDNQSFFGLQLGTAVVGANTNVMDWIGFARDYSV